MLAYLANMRPSRGAQSLNLRDMLLLPLGAISHITHACAESTHLRNHPSTIAPRSNTFGVKGRGVRCSAWSYSSHVPPLRNRNIVGLRREPPLTINPQAQNPRRNLTSLPILLFGFCCCKRSLLCCISRYFRLSFFVNGLATQMNSEHEHIKNSANNSASY